LIAGVAHHLFFSALLPPALFICTGLLGIVAALFLPRSGSILTVASLVGLYLLGTPFGSQGLLGIVERMVPWGAAVPGTAQAIVVLGGDKERGDGPQRERLGVLSRERVYDAARLYRVHHLPVLVTGGPLDKGSASLADLMADVLTRDFGVPVEWRERQARTTRENAELSARILREAHISNVVVVTQA
jgi:uncharacterized SAM-binding protein YcdF (DUF218 family)